MVCISIFILHSFSGESIDILGPKQINALNFIRMGLAIARTPGVRKNAKLNSNWSFKSDSDLRSLHVRLTSWLTSHKFGTYLTFRFLFGESIARSLSTQREFLAPVV